MGLFGYVVFLSLYLVIQTVTGFRHPLRGALIVIVLAFLYYAIVPGWVHARVAVGPNPASAVDAPIASLFAFDRQGRRATDQRR